MSLFIDEKTKEDKVKEAAENMHVHYFKMGEIIPVKYLKMSYLAGWNECEKHVKESVSEVFEREVTIRVHNAIDGLGAENKHYFDVLKDDNARLASENSELKAQIKERDEALFYLDQLKKDLVYTLSFCPQTENLTKGMAPMFYHSLTYEGDLEINRKLDEIRLKHQSLINQIKESGK